MPLGCSPTSEIILQKKNPQESLKVLCVQKKIKLHQLSSPTTTTQPNTSIPLLSG